MAPVVLPESLCQQYVTKHQEKPFSNDYTRAFLGCFSMTHFGKKKKKTDITDEFTEVDKVKKKRRQPSGPLVLTRFGSAVQKHKNALYPLIKHFMFVEHYMFSEQRFQASKKQLQQNLN